MAGRGDARGYLVRLCAVATVATVLAAGLTAAVPTTSAAARARTCRAAAKHHGTRHRTHHRTRARCVPKRKPQPDGIHKIKHVVVIMQ